MPPSSGVCDKVDINSFGLTSFHEFRCFVVIVTAAFAVKKKILKFAILSSLFALLGGVAMNSYERK
jgi:hypothetical protein